MPETNLFKHHLRSAALTRRAQLAAALPGIAQRIADFVDHLTVPAGSVVAGYWPVREEADPRALMKAVEARGAVLALPRIDARNTALSFRRWHESDPLFDNHHGIAEPHADAEALTPSIVLVPLLAFDNLGHRLGYGGGYYDRTLAGLRAKGSVVAIGIAYAGQEVAELPREQHDDVLDMILTENGLRRFPASHV